MADEGKEERYDRCEGVGDVDEIGIDNVGVDAPCDRVDEEKGVRVDVERAERVALVCVVDHGPNVCVVMRQYAEQAQDKRIPRRQ